MSEEEMVPPVEEELAAAAAGDGGIEDDGESDVVIQDTDIVFDCPHCGHNLAIDYRGAGLQINCVNCGESLLVPIPDGMKINDLDLEPGEILKQLFATRRNLQKTELRAAMLEERLAEQTGYRESVEARLAALRMQVEEMRQYCLQQQTANGKLLALIDVLAGASDESGAAPAEPA